MSVDYDVIKQEFDRVKDAWMARESVTDMGIGFKMIGGQQTEQLAIRVYVRQKLPLDQVPPRERIPDRVGEVLVDVIEGIETLE